MITNVLPCFMNHCVCVEGSIHVNQATVLVARRREKPTGRRHRRQVCDFTSAAIVIITAGENHTLLASTWLRHQQCYHLMMCTLASPTPQIFWIPICACLAYPVLKDPFCCMTSVAIEKMISFAANVAATLQRLLHRKLSCF